MKKLITLLFAVVVISLMMGSCTSSKLTTAKTMDITKTGIIQNTVIVDLTVKETKVSGQATGNVTANAQVNNEAVAAALKSSGADVLVEPVYSSFTKGSKITVTVTGYPATYTNFRSLKASDLELIGAGKSITVETVKTTLIQN